MTTNLFRTVRNALRDPADFVVMDDGNYTSIVDAADLDRWVEEHGEISSNAEQYGEFCGEVEHLTQFGAVGAHDARLARIGRLLCAHGARFAAWDDQHKAWRMPC